MVMMTTASQARLRGTGARRRAMRRAAGARPSCDPRSVGTPGPYLWPTGRSGRSPRTGSGAQACGVDWTCSSFRKSVLRPACSMSTLYSGL
eukprot:11853-Eustigmatos_ZCMA.PRE.1